MAAARKYGRGTNGGDRVTIHVFVAILFSALFALVVGPHVVAVDGNGADVRDRGENRGASDIAGRLLGALVRRPVTSALFLAALTMAVRSSAVRKFVRRTLSTISEIVGAVLVFLAILLFYSFVLVCVQEVVIMILMVV